MIWDWPKTFNPNLAISLHALPNPLSGLTRWNERLFKWCSDTGGGLAQDRPNAFNPDIAASRNNLTWHTTETFFNPDLAHLLKNLTNYCRLPIIGSPGVTCDKVLAQIIVSSEVPSLTTCDTVDELQLF